MHFVNGIFSIVAVNENTKYPWKGRSSFSYWQKMNACREQH